MVDTLFRIVTRETIDTSAPMQAGDIIEIRGYRDFFKMVQAADYPHKGVTSRFERYTKDGWKLVMTFCMPL